MDNFDIPKGGAITNLSERRRTRNLVCGGLLPIIS
jgi:hypothetical protein